MVAKDFVFAELDKNLRDPALELRKRYLIICRNDFFKCIYIYIYFNDNLRNQIREKSTLTLPSTTFNQGF